MFICRLEVCFDMHNLIFSFLFFFCHFFVPCIYDVLGKFFDICQYAFEMENVSDELDTVSYMSAGLDPRYMCIDTDMYNQNAPDMHA